MNEILEKMAELLIAGKQDNVIKIFQNALEKGATAF